jgi:hypothetical protein
MGRICARGQATTGWCRAASGRGMPVAVDAYSLSVSRSSSERAAKSVVIFALPLGPAEKDHARHAAHVPECVFPFEQTTVLIALAPPPHEGTVRTPPSAATRADFQKQKPRRPRAVAWPESP